MSEYPGRWKDEWNNLPEDMRDFATQFGPADDHVLLLGPTGSGKGYLAWILHELSPRAGGPFVQQNCGAITESLAEGTLFGSMKGAYTDATESKAGVIEAAEGGTLRTAFDPTRLNSFSPGRSGASPGSPVKGHRTRPETGPISV